MICIALIVRSQLTDDYRVTLGGITAREPNMMLVPVCRPRRFLEYIFARVYAKRATFC